MLPGLQPKSATIVWASGRSSGVEFDHPLHSEVFRAMVNDYARSRPTFEPATLQISAAA